MRNIPHPNPLPSEGRGDMLPLQESGRGELGKVHLAANPKRSRHVISLVDGKSLKRLALRLTARIGRIYAQPGESGRANWVDSDTRMGTQWRRATGIERSGDR